MRTVNGFRRKRVGKKPTTEKVGYPEPLALLGEVKESCSPQHQEEDSEVERQLDREGVLKPVQCRRLIKAFSAYLM
ncbi:hypothetical protein SRHO_G00109760 [Serrasalmus rhombeus]